MSGVQRCDEVLRLIDQVLAEAEDGSRTARPHPSRVRTSTDRIRLDQI